MKRSETSNRSGQQGKGGRSGRRSPLGAASEFLDKFAFDEGDKVHRNTLFEEVSWNLEKQTESLQIVYNLVQQLREDDRGVLLTPAAVSILRTNVARIIELQKYTVDDVRGMQEDADAQHDEMEELARRLQMAQDERKQMEEHHREVTELQAEVERRKTSLDSRSLQLLQPSASELMEGPSGQVALVFTDVESSTMLWEKAPDAMRQALALHNGLMRQKIRQHHGYEVKTEGDAFMIAFSLLPNTLKFCMEVQLGLLTLPWPAELLEKDSCGVQYDGDVLVFRGLRVRMGFDWGEPIAMQDATTGRTDYFGPVVNLIARVAGAARGGEVTFGAPAFQGLKTEKAFTDIVVACKGDRKLKGIEKFVTIYTATPNSLRNRKFTVHEVDKRLEDRIRLNWWITSCKQRRKDLELKDQMDQLRRELQESTDLMQFKALLDKQMQELIAQDRELANLRRMVTEQTRIVTEQQQEIQDYRQIIAERLLTNTGTDEEQNARMCEMLKANADILDTLTAQLGKTLPDVPEPRPPPEEAPPPPTLQPAQRRPRLGLYPRGPLRKVLPAVEPTKPPAAEPPPPPPPPPPPQQPSPSKYDVPGRLSTVLSASQSVLIRGGPSSTVASASISSVSPASGFLRSAKHVQQQQVNGGKQQPPQQSAFLSLATMSGDSFLEVGSGGAHPPAGPANGSGGGAVHHLRPQGHSASLSALASASSSGSFTGFLFPPPPRGRPESAGKRQLPHPPNASSAQSSNHPQSSAPPQPPEPPQAQPPAAVRPATAQQRKVITSRKSAQLGLASLSWPGLT